MPSSIDIGPVEGQVDAYASDGLDEVGRNTTMWETCKVRGPREINSKEILCKYH
jgi:hypothetical protein